MLIRSDDRAVVRVKSTLSSCCSTSRGLVVDALLMLFPQDGILGGPMRVLCIEEEEVENALFSLQGCCFCCLRLRFFFFVRQRKITTAATFALSEANPLTRGILHLWWEVSYLFSSGNIVFFLPRLLAFASSSSSFSRPVTSRLQIFPPAARGSARAHTRVCLSVCLR